MSTISDEIEALLAINGILEDLTEDGRARVMSFLTRAAAETAVLNSAQFIAQRAKFSRTVSLTRVEKDPRECTTGKRKGDGLSRSKPEWAKEWGVTVGCAAQRLRMMKAPVVGKRGRHKLFVLP